MGDAAKIAGDIYRELGALAFLIVVGALAFIYLVWRIVKAQDNISVTQAAILAHMAAHDARGGLIQQNQDQMHSTCKDHGQKLDYLHKGMVDFKVEVKEEITQLQTDVKVLQERVS